jgi:hypothetical protein
MGIGHLRKREAERTGRITTSGAWRISMNFFENWKRGSSKPHRLKRDLKVAAPLQPGSQDVFSRVIFSGSDVTVTGEELDTSSRLSQGFAPSRPLVVVL